MWEIISSAVVLWILAKVNPGVIIKKKKKLPRANAALVHKAH